VCRITRGPDGLILRKADPAFPVLLNGSPVFGADPVRLQNGDRVAVGPADVTVSVGTGHLRPKFVPVSPAPSVEVVREPTNERDRLLKLSAELEQQARELEADRVLWYRRREEIEAECRRMRDEAKTGPADLAKKASELASKEQELARVREELDSLRQSLADQYQERKAQLDQMQEVVRGTAASLRERERQFEAGVARRKQELDERVQAAVEDWRKELERQFARRAADLEAEWVSRQPELEQQIIAREADLTAREEQLKDNLSRYSNDLARLDRWQASLAEKQRDLDRRAAAVDSRHEQLTRDAVELEENIRLGSAEQERLAAEADRLAKARADQEALSARMAERSAQLEAQQAMLAILRARLDRQEEDARDEAARLAADRARMDIARRDLDDRLRDAERLRAELTIERDDQAEKQRGIAEQSALLEMTLAEIQQQKDAAAAEQARLAAKEAELDARAAEIAEQTAVLKARATQVMELQERLEADRTALRERETTLTDADTARQTFQEQLRRRSEGLAARSRILDDAVTQLAQEKAELDSRRKEVEGDKERAEKALASTREELAARASELDKQSTDLAGREAALRQQIARLREAGRAVAAARKEIAESRTKADSDRRDVEAYRLRSVEELQALRREAPDLEDRALAALERLTSVRDVLRGHLGELHSFAGQTRDDLDAARSQLKAEADRLRDREQAVEKARAEHRLAVAEFRQQLHDWQARVTELKQTMSRTETRVDARRAEASEVARQADAAAIELARQTEELRQERQRLADRRGEVERHLTDMREWYRKKLRELAASNAERGRNEQNPSAIAGRIDSEANRAAEELDPGDKQLGDLLRTMELVDADTLAALWAEAGRQRRTLRHVLLASGAVTLYQLALIEAGNLDALVLGRLRVVDRLRVTPREAVYRVFDPTHADGPNHGIFLLRHLAEAEMEDAVRPDEFRQRFGAAKAAADPHLANTVEVLDLQGRPAALQEWVTGLPSAEWPPEAAAPGVWVKLLASAAAGIDAAHRAGLVHGRLTSDSFVLTADGVLKVTGFGEPPWLSAGSAATTDPTPDADLRALGQVAYGWSQAGQAGGRRRSRGRAFPESLTAVVRRLETDAETPMADTVAGAVPYRSAADLVADLARLAALFPCPPDAWDRLVRHVADIASSDALPLRQSA
jgi:chromosome segregation ATPase